MSEMVLDDMAAGVAFELEPFEVFRRGGLYLGTAIAALVVAVAVAILAIVRGPVWLWPFVAALVFLGLLALPGIADARTPVFVADEHGVRLHERDTWVGLLWSEIGALVIQPGSLAHDARITIYARDGQHTYATPIGFTTTVSAPEAEVELARRRAAGSY